MPQRSEKLKAAREAVLENFYGLIQACGGDPSLIESDHLEAFEEFKKALMKWGLGMVHIGMDLEKKKKEQSDEFKRKRKRELEVSNDEMDQGS